MRAFTLIVSIAALATAGTAAAKPLMTEQFKAATAVSIDPAKAYLLVRGLPMDLKLLRSPTPAEIVAYQAERAEALAKARANHVKALKRYETELKDYERAGDTARMTMARPVKPTEPTEENSAFKAIESDNFVTIWSGRVFDKAGPRNANLIAVPPGTYRIYGTMLDTGNGITGFCLCMGSVQFEAAAGKITDMGTMRYPAIEAAKEKVEPSWNGMTPGKGGLTAMRVEPVESSTYVPPVIAAMPRAPADYRAAGKANNFFGALIERMTPLAGVLAYKRDEVIDVKSGTAVASN